MKKIQKEEVSFYNVYVANDGTEFRSEEECKKYDESALGVVRARYQKLVVNRGAEDDVCGLGSDDCSVEVLKIKNQEDVNTVMQRFVLENPHLQDGADHHNKTITNAEKKVSLALLEDDALLVSRGCCDDYFWVIGTALSMKEKIDAFVKPTEEKKD